MKKKNTHVVPSQGNWADKSKGSEKEANLPFTKEKAILISKEIAQSRRLESFSQKAISQIRHKTLCGSDNSQLKAQSK